MLLNEDHNCPVEEPQDSEYIQVNTQDDPLNSLAVDGVFIVEAGLLSTPNAAVFRLNDTLIPFGCKHGERVF